jgi:hydrocephalus-inducing protein
MRNNDKVARIISIEPPNSTIFSIVTKIDPTKKIAAGMEATYIVRFTPDSEKDYQYDLICTTEREKFAVPIRTIGARGVVDVPDGILYN